MAQAPKARFADEVYPLVEFVVKVTRPHGDPPAFWIEDEEGELKQCYPFDTEQGRHFSELIGQRGVTYHKACVTVDGEFGLESAELEGHSW